MRARLALSGPIVLGDSRARGLVRGRRRERERVMNRSQVRVLL